MITELQKGGNCALAGTDGTVYIKHTTSDKLDISLTAFLLDDSGKVQSDEGMVFFNQPNDPANIARFKPPVHEQGITTHQIDFSLKTDAKGITKIAITLTEDNGLGFADLNMSAEVHCEGSTTQLVPQAFSSEKGIIVAEIYRRNEQTKVRSVWQGFSTGLAGLCELYGVEVDDETQTQPASQSASQPVSQPTSQPTSQPEPTPKPPQPAPVSVSVAKASPGISLEKVSGKVDLSKGTKAVIIAKTPEITVSVSWNSSTDYDVYALVYLSSGEQVDVAMFAAQGVPPMQSYGNGAVHHSGDVGRTKTGFFQKKDQIAKEEIKIRLNDSIKAVVPVAYSAQSNGTGSFHKYKVSMLIDNHSGTEVNIPSENANKNNKIYTCVPGVIVNTPDGVVIKALEYYSQPGSEHRPKLTMGEDGMVDVLMDQGPVNAYK